MADTIHVHNCRFNSYNPKAKTYMIRIFWWYYQVATFSRGLAEKAYRDVRVKAVDEDEARRLLMKDYRGHDIRIESTSKEG